jgi:hypothetical protein
MAPRKNPTGQKSAHSESWRTLEEQLQAAGASPGGALDELIRANQDLSLLRGERPRPDLPPWLRVYWRKAHPDARGYPLTIKRLQGWLQNNPDRANLSGSAPKR